MSYMVKKELSAKELFELIRVSASCGVSELKFGALELRFGKPTENKSELLSVNEITEPNHEEINKESLEIDTMRVKKDQLDQMFLENPSLAEQLLADEDLDEDDDGTE